MFSYSAALCSPPGQTMTTSRAVNRLLILDFFLFPHDLTSCWPDRSTTSFSRLSLLDTDEHNYHTAGNLTRGNFHTATFSFSECTCCRNVVLWWKRWILSLNQIFGFGLGGENERVMLVFSPAAPVELFSGRQIRLWLYWATSSCFSFVGLSRVFPQRENYSFPRYHLQIHITFLALSFSD